MRVQRLYPQKCECNSVALYKYIPGEGKAAKYYCQKCLPKEATIENPVPVKPATKIRTNFGCKEINNGDVTAVEQQMTQFEKSRGETRKFLKELRKDHKKEFKAADDKFSGTIDAYMILVDLGVNDPPREIVIGQNRLYLFDIDGRTIAADTRTLTPKFYMKNGKIAGYV